MSIRVPQCRPRPREGWDVLRGPQEQEGAGRGGLGKVGGQTCLPPFTQESQFVHLVGSFPAGEQTMNKIEQYNGKYTVQSRQTIKRKNSLSKYTFKRCYTFASFTCPRLLKILIAGSPGERREVKSRHARSPITSRSLPGT